ncbi:MAG: hypothetical protein E7439_05040, partial [Ruminococcaceae bacterium]|nr:hypothetical protein [Oscillospiraceae bacterium]
MKLTKRILSVMLVLSMVLAMCPAIIFAEETTTPVVEAVDVGTLGASAQKAGLSGRDENGSNVMYLSDLYSTAKLKDQNNTKVTLDKNHGNSLYVHNQGTLKGVSTNADATTGIYTANGGRNYTKSEIALGWNGVKYGKGLGVMPDPIGGEDRYIVYSTSSLDVDRFYAVVGGTGFYLANQGKSGLFATFEVWGSTAEEYTADAEFVKLAYTEKIRAYLVAEFDVDISDYHYIKLVVRMSGEYNDASGNPINTGCELAWGDACFYKSTGAKKAQVLANLGQAAQNAGLKGKHEDAKNVNYLSDLYSDTKYMVDQNNSKVMADQNYNGDLYVYDGTGTGGRKQIKANLAEDGTRTLANGITYLPTDIALGINGTKYAKGLGVHPDAGSAADRYITYDVSGLGAERFYAVVGATGTNITNFTLDDYKVTFELWGAKYNSPASFEKLAVADGLRAYVISEFDVDISGYNYIKLVVRMTDGYTSNASCAVAWADACVYSIVDEVKYSTMNSATQQQPGHLAGIPAGVTSQYYLSGMPIAQVNNKVSLNREYSDSLFLFVEGARKGIKGNAETDEDGNRTFTKSDGSTVTFNQQDIVLGWDGIKYDKGIGMHPNGIGGEDRYIVYDIRGMNAEYFYAVAGATGANITNAGENIRRVEMEVWGSKGNSYDENGFVKLASVEGIRAFLISEFNVNVEGYNYIKLVVRMDETSYDNASCPVAWGNACVYSTKASNIPSFSTKGTDKGTVDAGGSYNQHTYTGVSKSEVTAYESTLTSGGWTQYDVNTIVNPDTKAENYFATYVDGKGTMIHLNYFAGMDNGKFHIIYGPDSWLVPKTEIGTGENIVTPSVTVLKMSVGTLSMVVQLADGSFIVIDGGYGYDGELKDLEGNPIWIQDPTYLPLGKLPATGVRDFKADMQNLLTFMEENKPESHEKPQVYWMATHAHSDHVQLAYLTIWGTTDLGDGKVTNERFDLKGIIYNFPNYENIGLDYTHEEEGADGSLFFNAYSRFVAKSVEYFPDVEQYIYHTGQTLKIPGGEIEFLYTAEDIRPYSMRTMNHTSGVWRFNFDGGKSLMITGDAQQLSYAETANNDHLTKVFGSYLKSDMLQVVHHGSNGGSEAFYKAVDPSICFWGQVDENFETDLRMNGTFPGFEFNKVLRNGERVHYTCSANNTVYIPTVTYNDNGIIKADATLYSTATPAEGTNPDGSGITVLDSYSSKSGYKFYGWATSPNGVVAYKPGEAVTLTESVNLYAAYAPVLPNLGKAGVLNGMTGDVLDVTYLSDLHNPSNPLAEEGRVVGQNNSKIVLNGEYSSDLYAFDGTNNRYRIKANLAADGTRTLGNGVAYKPTDIALGYNGIKYEKGLGVHPDAGNKADRYIVYNVAGLGDHFYAVVGATGMNSSDPKGENYYITFELWGSKASTYDSTTKDSFVKLASAEKIRSYLTAEFDVDITGYNYIKLVVRMSDGYTTNSSCAVAWGNASVYSITRPALGKTGVLNGRPENVLNINYLSDLYSTDKMVAQLNSKVVADGNYNGGLFAFVEGVRKDIANAADTDADGNRTITKSDGTTVTFNKNDIVLGYDGIKYDKGLGVHPDAIGKEDRYIIYNVAGLGDRFYAVAGATGYEITDADANVRRVVFEVWGSTATEYSEDMVFEQIARADKIRAYVVSEFDLDITGYNFIKLVVKMDPTSDANTSCAVAWGDACVYSANESTCNHTAGAAVKENNKAPTCGDAGSYDMVTYCTKCGEEMSRETTTVAATGKHSWNDGVITTKPTSTTDGVKTYTCSVCGGTKTETIGKFTAGVINPKSVTLSLDDLIFLNVYSDYTGGTLSQEYIETHGGLI